MDIGAWLRGLGMERYDQAFRDNEIDARSLIALTYEDLKEIGVVAIGHRRVLLNAINALRKGGAEARCGPSATRTPEPESRAERRQVSVMFCDLVGSTRMAARLDPEEMRDVIAAFHAATERVVTRFGGHVAKFMGDGALVYFGYPVANEDDPERAVRAGLDLIAAMPGLGRTHGENLQVRIGIDTGLVVVGEIIGEGMSREESVVGTTPNLAARLQGVAEPDSIVVSARTLRLLGETFTHVNLGEVELKGFEGQRVAAHRIIGPAHFETRFAARSPAVVTDLLGRGPELAILNEAWERGLAGEGQAVLLEGEAGVGKSRIISAFQSTLTGRPHRVISLQCAAFSANTEFQPLRDFFWRGMGAERDARPEAQLDVLERVLRTALDQSGEALAHVAAMMNIDDTARVTAPAGSPQKQRHMTIRWIAEFFSRLTARDPVLFVVEDAHWIDPSTEEFLDHFIPSVAHCRAVLLISSRSGMSEAWLGQAHVRRLTMGRLTPKHAERMIDAIAGQPMLPEAVKRQIIGRADGIPLYVEELTRAVLETEIAFDDADEPVLAAAVPASLQDSLMARLDRLGEARNVAQIAAALGRDFTEPLLAAAMALRVDQVAPLLGRLTEAGLILHDPGDDRATYRFRHALVRDTAYESLLKRRRREVHGRIAAALESMQPAIAEDEPEILAHHLTEAENIPRAIDCWTRAGTRSYERSASKEAIHHISRALDLLARQPPSVERDRMELALQSDLGSSIMTVRGFAVPEVHRAFARAFEICQTVGEGVDTSRVLRGLCWFYVSQSRLDMALDLAHRLVELAEREQDRGLMMVGCQSLGIVLLFLGRPGDALASLEKGVGLYRPDEDKALGFRYGVNPGANCLILYALALWLTGYPDQARMRIAETDEMLAAMNHPLTTALTRSWIARIYAMFATPEAALEVAEAVAAYAREQSIRLCEAEGMIVRGWARVAAGKAPDATALVEGIAMWRATGSLVVEPFYLWLLADAHVRLGDHAAAAGVIDAALAAVEERGERWWLPEIHRQKGRVLQATGAGREAVQVAFQTALDLARRQEARSLELRAATSLARLWTEAGHGPAGQEVLSARYDSFSEGFATEDLKQARELLGKPT